MYVAPYSVSGRVVKTVMVRSASASSWTSRSRSVELGVSSGSATLKSISAPTLLPIQFRCISFSDSGHSRPSRSAIRRSA